MKNSLTSQQIPYKWAVCFLPDCPLAETCLRHRAAQLLPPTVKKHAAVLPSARQDEVCSLYVSAEPVRMAWGLRHTFGKVLPAHYQAMRPHLEAYFGSHTTFYRYYNGLRPITPTQQAWLTQLLRSMGYDTPPRFDREEETFDFTA